MELIVGSRFEVKNKPTFIADRIVNISPILQKIDSRLRRYKPIHLCWLFDKLGLPIPRYLIGESAIDVGAPAIDRDGNADPVKSYVCKENAANVSGVLTHFYIYVSSAITGCKVGVFYTVNGNTLKCRSVHNAGNLGSGYHDLTVSLAISAGDYIGVYVPNGAVEYSTGAGPGIWYTDGDALVVDNQTVYGVASPRNISLYGTGVTAPDAPSGCTAHYVATNNTKCTWVDNSGMETNFRIEVDVNDAGFAFWKNVGANIEDSGTYTTGANKKVRFRVLAYNAVGNSGWSTSGYVYTIPTAPTNLAATWLVEYETARLTYTKNQAYGDIDIFSQVDLGGFAHLAYDDVSPYDDTTPGENYSYEYKIRARSPQNDDSSYTYSAFTAVKALYAPITLSESIGLLESVAIGRGPFLLEEAIALNETITNVPTSADVVLEETLALAESFVASEQTIVRIAATAAFLVEQAERSNQPVKRIWLCINSTLYDVTDKFMSMGAIDRKMAYEPGKTKFLTISGQTLVMSNADKYFSDLNPTSLFYDRAYSGVDQIKVYAGFVIPATGYAEVLQKADMKLITIKLATKEGMAYLECQDSFRDVFDIYVGMPEPDGTPAPLTYAGKTFKYIMDNLLIDKAGIASGKVSIEDVDLTFTSISFEKMKIGECIQELSEVARGSTTVSGDGTVQFTSFVSEGMDVDLTLRSGENYSKLTYTGQDIRLKVNKIVVIGAAGIYAEAELSGEVGMTLKYENALIESVEVAQDVAAECLGRFSGHTSLVEIAAEYLPSLDVKSIIRVYEPSSMMDPKIFQITGLALDIVRYNSRLLVKSLGAAGEAKTWSTRSELESGTLVDVLVPEGVERLELKRLELSGTATYIFDAGSGRTADWKYFDHSKEYTEIIYRDDFRDNNLEAWTTVGGTWQGVNQYMRGTGNVSWQTNRVRVGPTTWEGLDILIKALRQGSADHRFYLRADAQGNDVNAYVLLVDGGNVLVNRGRVYGGNIYDYVKIADGADQADTWNWIRIQVFTEEGNVVTRIKWWLPEESEPGWKASYTWTGEWRSAGCFSLGRHSTDPGKYNYYDDILISRKEGVPSPANCTVTFQFWSGVPDNGGITWTGPHAAIADVADSRYIKIAAAFARDDLLSAMPVLNNLTVGYFLKA